MISEFGIATGRVMLYPQACCYIHWYCIVHAPTAVSAARDAAGQIDVNKAMEYKAKFDELTADDSSKKDD